MLQRKSKYNKKQQAQYNKTEIQKDRWVDGAEGADGLGGANGAEEDEDVDHTEEVDGTENNGVGDGGDKHKRGRVGSFLQSRNLGH